MVPMLRKRRKSWHDRLIGKYQLIKIKSKRTNDEFDKSADFVARFISTIHFLFLGYTCVIRIIFSKTIG